MWGKDSDWFRNVVAGGLIEVRRGEKAQKAEWRELDEAARGAALEAYRDAHPIYSRAILAAVCRVNGFKGDGDDALRKQLPMLALRPTGPSTHGRPLE
jgi:hypothetical protein